MVWSYTLKFLLDEDKLFILLWGPQICLWKKQSHYFADMTTLFYKSVGHCSSWMGEGWEGGRSYGIWVAMQYLALAFSYFSKMVWIISLLYLPSLYEYLRYSTAFQIDQDESWGIWLSRGMDSSGHGQQQNTWRKEELDVSCTWDNLASFFLALES